MHPSHRRRLPLQWPHRGTLVERDYENAIADLEREEYLRDLPLYPELPGDEPRDGPPSVAEATDIDVGAPPRDTHLRRCRDRVCRGGVLDPGDLPATHHRHGQWHREQWDQVRRCSDRNRVWRSRTRPEGFPRNAQG